MLRKTGLGVIAGIFYMGAEGVGSLYLIKLILKHLDTQQASQYVLITYMLVGLNILGNSLGFTTARNIAKTSNPDLYSSILQIATKTSKTLFIPIAIFGILLISVTTISTQLTLPLALTWILFLLGHLTRTYGLVKAYIAVGDGLLGVDKFFQSLFVLLFYATAVPFASKIDSILYLSLIYFLVATFSTVAISYWLKKYITSKEHIRTEATLTSAQLLRESSIMIIYSVAGYAAGNSDALIARFLLGDSKFVQYALAAKLGQVTALVAGLVPAMYGPRLTKYFHHNQMDAFKKATKESNNAALLIGCLGAALLMLFRFKIANFLTPSHQEIFTEVIIIMSFGAIVQALCLSLSNIINSVGGKNIATITAISAIIAAVTSTLFWLPLKANGIALGTVAGSIALFISLTRIQLNLTRSS